jgi:hypothetical protein
VQPEPPGLQLLHNEGIEVDTSRSGQGRGVGRKGPVHSQEL